MHIRLRLCMFVATCKHTEHHTDGNKYICQFAHPFNTTVGPHTMFQPIS